MRYQVRIRQRASRNQFLWVSLGTTASKSTAIAVATNAANSHHTRSQVIDQLADSRGENPDVDYRIIQDIMGTPDPYERQDLWDCDNFYEENNNWMADGF